MVFAAVVDKYDFVGKTIGLHYPVNPGSQLGKRFVFVKQRDNNGNVHQSDYFIIKFILLADKEREDERHDGRGNQRGHEHPANLESLLGLLNGFINLVLGKVVFLEHLDQFLGLCLKICRVEVGIEDVTVNV